MHKLTLADPRAKLRAMQRCAWSAATLTLTPILALTPTLPLTPTPTLIPTLAPTLTLIALTLTARYS